MYSITAGVIAGIGLLMLLGVGLIIMALTGQLDGEQDD